MATETLRDIVWHSVEAYGEQTTFWYKTKKGIIDKAYNEVNLDSMAVSRTMEALRMKGKHTVIVDIASYQWTTTYFGIVNSGSVAVPVDAQLPAEAVCGLLSKADVGMLVYDELRSDAAGVVRGKRPGIRYVVSVQAQETVGGMLSLSRLMAGHAGTHEVELTSGQLRTIPSTSGTTGRSKGVMLNRGNLADSAVCLNVRIPARIVSVILLSTNHVYCLTMDIIKRLYIGMIICTNDSIIHVQRNMKLFEPEIVLLMPLVIESIYGKLKDAGSLIPKEMVAKTALGGGLRIVCSGGVCLDPDYVDRFGEYGITILQSYGMMECSPVISTNLEQENKKGSVGKLLPNCEAGMVGEEIWVRGSSVMQGYYKISEQTAETPENGWLKTGGLGYVDEDNFVYIIDYRKNLTTPTNGENVSPEELENKPSCSELVKGILVREKDKIMEAEILPDYKYAKKKYIRDIQGKLRELIDKSNRGMPAYKRIYGLTVRETEFEKTPSKKIKRF